MNEARTPAEGACRTNRHVRGGLRERERRVAMRTGMIWNPWQELGDFRREVSALMNGGPRWGNGWAEGPSFNVHSREHGVLLTAELPGFDASAFEVSVENDTVTVRGRRDEETAAGNVRYHL